jgi:type VI protein secretion system component VasF
MEPQYQSVSQMYERLLLMIRQRNDTGFRLAVNDAVLQPRNPFEPVNKRRPKPTVAIGTSLVVVLVLIFLYFSLHAHSF